MTFDRSGMRSDMSGLVNDWGIPCQVKRKMSPTTGADGHVTAVLSTLVSAELLWIQPVGSVGSYAKGIRGIDTETSHLVFQRWAGTLLKAEDKIIVSGQTDQYDVLHHHKKESFNLYEARIVEKV